MSPQSKSIHRPRNPGKPPGIARPVLWAASFATCVIASALPGQTDKSSYTLFHPTPMVLLRDLSTDRLDQTESPCTVDAGRFQIEMDFVNYTLDNGDSVRTRELSVAAMNLKVGLLHHVDFQLVINPYVRSTLTDHSTGTTTKVSDSGDVSTRLKINFWGNDGGKTAFAFMPFVKFPLQANNIRNGRTEGGLIFPFAAELPGGWGMGAMTEIDFVNDGTGGYDTEWLNSLTFGRDLTAKLGSYVEFVAITGSAPGFQWQGQLDIGFTYALARNTQLDWGCNFGVTKSAPDYQPFLGLTRRF